MKQKIIVTALPGGISSVGGAWKVSASIGLQVEDAASNSTLQNVKDMLGWADLVKNGKFLVHLNGKPVEAKIVSKPVDTELWKNLFTPTVKVKSFEQEDLSKIPIASYPVKHILGFIKFVVEATGKNFSKDLPGSTDYTENPVMKSISDYNISDEFPKRGRQPISMERIVADKQNGSKIKRLLNQKKFIPFNAVPEPTTDFAQLKNFHGLYDNKQVKTFVQVDKPDFEFHDILSILGNYPQLQRRLGLIFDLEFSPALTPTLRGADQFIRVIPSNINFTTATTFVCPATAYTKTASGFYAEPLPGSTIDRGHLKLNTDAFTVFQVDTDGAALKLCQQVDALQLRKAKHIFYAAEGMMPNAAAIPLFSNEAPRKEGLPSHRSAGIAIARNGMAENLSGKFQRMNEWRSKLVTGDGAPIGVNGNNVTWILTKDLLYADDINLGYRMDVKPETSSWFSLHKRHNRYSYFNNAATAIDIPGMDIDEGFIQTSASEEKTDTGTHLKVGEAIARWEGWSLSVPRPGSALNDPILDKQEVYDKSKPANVALENKKYTTPPTSDFKLNIHPGIEKGSLPMLRFGKKYSIKIRTVDLAGNSVDVNSKPENDTAVVGNIRYMRYEPVDAPFLVLGSPVKDGESSEVMVIRSNGNINEKPTVDEYEKANALGTPFADESVRHVKPPRTTVEMATTHGMFEKGIGPASDSQAGVIYDDIAKKTPFISEFPDSATPYKLAVLPGNGPQKIIEVEYLADPMAAGVSFFVSPNDPNFKPPDPEIYSKRVSFYFDKEVTDAAANANTVAEYEKWMSPKTFRIVLREGDAQVAWDEGERILKVTLPKGIIFKMSYACFWRPEDIKKYSGILDMMGITSLTDALGQRIAKGQHWMFSPWREITFVHAVQQPLSKFGTQTYPFISELKAEREFGENTAKINIKLLAHGPSTDKLDIEADWIDWIDDVSYSEEPPYKAKDDVKRIAAQSKVFHFTTLYRIFEYVFGLVKENPFHAINHQFNDTKHRKVNYKAIASSRYREYFFQLAKTKNEDFLTRESNKITSVIIPSSARPAAPQVEYVIPNFEWDRNTKGNATITGRGSGLRVYLKRPWYSSGEGEQLAVILPVPAISDTIGNSNGATYTTWGTDPTKLSSSLPVKDSPNINAFVKLKNMALSLSVAEHPTARVMIAAYDVNYDKDRQLYYADIMINFGLAYFPFVRLALARFQLNSVMKGLQDCCLSNIVQADYIQIPPPRFSSLVYGSTKNNITVAISGSIPSMSGAPESYTKVQFLIERIDVPSSDQTHITLAGRPIEEYSYILNANDIKNFTFTHSKVFSLPAEYATRPYRIKVLEFEMITSDPIKPNPNPGGANFSSMPKKERLVFADVYEVNK